MDIYKEEVFYQDDGYPTESFDYCEYIFYTGEETEYGPDYDQFAVVINSFYPYIRLTKKRDRCHFPCGLSDAPSPQSTYAQKTDSERDVECPKIAWGIAAKFLSNIRYDSNQKDYVLSKELEVLFNEYYERYWNFYRSSHNGLRLSNISDEQKELDFIAEHLKVNCDLWRKSKPLKKYSDLYKYASDVVNQYEEFLFRRKQIIDSKLMPRNNCFSTEIRVPYENKPCIKVFFLDDSFVHSSKSIVETLNCVKNVNITESNSKVHPGYNLTVYPKPMVDAKLCEKEVTEILNSFFLGSYSASTYMSIKTDAYFNNIEKQVINDLNLARVSIHVAMAWFTNQRIADKLIEKFNEGLDVKVVSFDDHINAKFGVNIGPIPHKEVKGARGGKMHHKFCVIDNQKVITGSYNWSENAENKNDENAAVMYDYDRASDFSVEFRKLFDSE